MAKKVHHEEHEEHPDETWLVPYADVLTLLLALFIVLFAVSQVDTVKLKAMAESFAMAFMSAGSEGIFSEPSFIPKVNPSPQRKIENQQDRESAQLHDMQASLQKYIEANDLGGQLETRITEQGLLIVIKDNLFFRPGSADLLPTAEPIARTLATMLSTMSQKVLISGHTDDTPIDTPEFPSNWDLSSKRAINFLRYMLAHEPFLRPARFSAIGYAEFQPIYANTTPENRQRNRRVEVLIMRDYPRDRGFDYNNEEQ